MKVGREQGREGERERRRAGEGDVLSEREKRERSERKDARKMMKNGKLCLEDVAV